MPGWQRFKSIYISWKRMKSIGTFNCFLVLAHRNSRLETKGEYKGTQLWTSAGYTYEVMDILFGNEEKGIPSLSYPRSQT